MTKQENPGTNLTLERQRVVNALINAVQLRLGEGMFGSTPTKHQNKPPSFRGGLVFGAELAPNTPLEEPHAR